jgi:hypothetical protein
MRTFVTVLALAALVMPASAQFDIYELVPPPGRPYDPTWPPDGPETQWHQIQPAADFCTYAPQTDHDDADGDGVISVCDNIQIGGEWKHIEWVGPTIAIEPVGGGDMLLIEPVGRQNDYHIIHPPEFACMIVPITGDIVTECEVVIVDPPSPYAGEWHIVEINTNIHTNGGSPVEPSTWSKIKDFFKGLF